MWSKHIIYKILKDEKRTKRCNHWIPTVPTKIRIIKLIPKGDSCWQICIIFKWLRHFSCSKRIFFLFLIPFLPYIFYRIQCFKFFIQNVHWESECLNIQILWKPQNKYSLKVQLNNPEDSHESITASIHSLINISL